MPTLNWSTYRSFPNPKSAEYLHAPLGPGLYDLRRISTKKPVLFGIGANCAQRRVPRLDRPRQAVSSPGALPGAMLVNGCVWA